MANPHEKEVGVDQMEEELAQSVGQINITSSQIGSPCATNVKEVADVSAKGGDMTLVESISTYGFLCQSHALSVQKNLCRPAITNNKPIHLCALFVGNKDSWVSDICRDNMHKILRKELKRDGQHNRALPPTQQRWILVLKRTFRRMDRYIRTKCPCGTSPRKTCPCNLRHPAELGSNTLVTIVTPDQIIVASCGESRAFLTRNDVEIPLNSEHTLDRPDECERIHAILGRERASRIMGKIHVTRSIGSHWRRLIISRPEVMFMDHMPEDENLVLKSATCWRRELFPEILTEGVDGMWRNAAGEIVRNADGFQRAKNDFTSYAIAFNKKG